MFYVERIELPMAVFYHHILLYVVGWRECPLSYLIYKDVNLVIYTGCYNYQTMEYGIWP